MTKNITVTDENGKVIGSTYPKRALGLVKKGRAQRINADTICLCARDETEDNKMANNIYEILDNQISKMQEQLTDADDKAAAQVRIEILRTMEKVNAQERDLKVIDVIEKQLNSMSAALAAEPVTAESAPMREATRQEMLKLMNKLVSGDTPDNQQSRHVNIGKLVNNKIFGTDNPHKETEDEAKETDEAIKEVTDSAFDKTNE